MKNRIIIGIAGHPSGGKDTVAYYLVKKYKFVHISTSDILRNYIKEHQLGDLSRENMNMVVTGLREQFGTDFLVRDILETNNDERLVLSGLRSSGEAKAITAVGGILVAVDASLKVRYKRALQRGRIGENISFDEFVKEQEKEDNPTNPNAPSVAAVTSVAQEHIDNSSTRAHTYTQVDSLMKRLNIS